MSTKPTSIEESLEEVVREYLNCPTDDTMDSNDVSFMGGAEFGANHQYGIDMAKQQWISVENMPSRYGHYLTCFAKGDYISYEVAQLYKRQDGTYCFTDNEDISQVMATHWQPLPEPPKI